MSKPSEGVINAFHPDYIKTYHPEFISEMRTASAQTRAGKTMSAYVEKKRETVPSHGTVFGLNEIPAHITRKSMTAKARAELAPKEFHVFSKAGTSNTTKKKK